MAILSMTGFGKSESMYQGASCVIEVRSVNNRFLDISCKLPKNLAYLENSFKNQIKDKLVRGSVIFSVTLGAGTGGNIPVSYNEAAIAKFVDITRKMQEKFGIAGEIKLEHVLALPEVLQFTDADADSDALEKHLAAELDKALDQVNEMRAKEGANLARDLEGRVNHLNAVLDKIEVLDPQRIEVWKEKFKERINVLLKDSEIDDVRLLLLGQDPYHQRGQAHGMCFSVNPGVQIPPSLVNIFKELQDDLGYRIPNNGYLMPWAKQGVFLLNTVMTVERGRANSHQGKGWEIFTDHVIERINAKEEPVVFLLWGRNARNKAAMIDPARHLVLQAAHPSPLSAYKGFFGCRHFSKANAFLEKNGMRPIRWQIDDL